MQRPLLSHQSYPPDSRPPGIYVPPPQAQRRTQAIDPGLATLVVATCRRSRSLTLCVKQAVKINPQGDTIELMNSEIRYTIRSDGIRNNNHVGGGKKNGSIVARGKCPFCEIEVAFRQIGKGLNTSNSGEMVALHCDNCKGIVSCQIQENKIFPSAPVSGLDNLPDGIDSYYQEALRCISANAPNGAATVLRKVIHSVCLYYGVAEVDSNSTIYDMIQTLAEEDHITETLRQSLLGIKDAGNDGAHINENDPTLEQARNMKEIIDAVLTATVIADQKVETLREDHPNPHQE